MFAFGEPVDMRKSFDTLSALVTNTLKKELLSGDVFLFVGRDRRRAKALFWDGTGLCLYSKRLEKGRFAPLWKRDAQGVPTMTMSELSLFLEGSELVGKVSLSPEPFVLGAPRSTRRVRADSSSG